MNSVFNNHVQALFMFTPSKHGPKLFSVRSYLHIWTAALQVHYTALYCTAIYFTAWNLISLHTIALHCTALHCMALSIQCYGSVDKFQFGELGKTPKISGVCQNTLHFLKCPISASYTKSHNRPTFFNTYELSKISFYIQFISSLCLFLWIEVGANILKYF